MHFFFLSWQKITTKNAFGLHLIDYMADILKQKDSEVTNFKVWVLFLISDKSIDATSQSVFILFKLTS